MLKIAVICSRFSTSPVSGRKLGMRSGYSIFMHWLPMLINICISTCFHRNYCVFAVKAEITVSSWVDFLPWCGWWVATESWHILGVHNLLLLLAKLIIFLWGRWVNRGSHIPDSRFCKGSLLWFLIFKGSLPWFLIFSEIPDFFRAFLPDSWYF